MEARSQLRHRPSREMLWINFSTARGHRPLGGVRFQIQIVKSRYRDDCFDRFTDQREHPARPLWSW